jgi:hypothetical protein
MSKKQKPAFQNLRWSEADDQLLKDMIARGADGTTISNALGRTRSSVFNRKHQLGLEGKIKRSPKGQAGILTYATRTTKEVSPSVDVEVTNNETPQSEVKKAKTPKKTKVKVQTETKVEKGRLSQTAKLAQINRRLRRGDVRKVAEKVGFTEGFVSAVLSGSYPNERTINVAYNMVRGRKTNEQMMKKGK